MPQRKAGRVAPLKKFSVPVVSWRPNSRQFKQFQENCRITYTVPEPIKIQGKDWHCVWDIGLNHAPLLLKKYFRV